MRRRYRQVQNPDGSYSMVEITKGASGVAPAGPAVFGDYEDFVSPIDGTTVHGRAGVRRHCAEHDVVPTRDLAGLPPKRSFEPHVHSKADRESIRRTMAGIIDRMKS